MTVMRARMQRTIEESAKHVVLAVVAFIMMIPLLWMAATSLKSPREVFTGSLFWPSSLNWEGYYRVFTDIPFFLWLYNSLLISVLTTAAQLVVGVLAAYAFAHFRFPGRDALFLFVLMTMMIPSQVTMVPTYMIVNELNWLNTFKGVIVPGIASGYAIFLLRQSFLTIPKELGEAATIDGCGPLRMLWHIYIRLSYTVLAALTVILFVGNWNEFHWPLLVLSDKSLLPLPIAFVQFREEQNLEWVPTMAVATLSMLPVLALYLAAQKSFIEGLANSGLKG